MSGRGENVPAPPGCPGDFPHPPSGGESQHVLSSPSGLDLWEKTSRVAPQFFTEGCVHKEGAQGIGEMEPFPRGQVRKQPSMFPGQSAFQAAVTAWVGAWSSAAGGGGRGDRTARGMESTAEADSLADMSLPEGRPPERVRNRSVSRRQPGWKAGSSHGRAVFREPH